MFACYCKLHVTEMFDWLYSIFDHSHGHACSLPPVHPKDLPYSVSRVMLNRELDAPYYNQYWDYPLKGENLPKLEYSDKMNHGPLFSSRDQIVNSQCLGKLHFLRSTNPSEIQIDQTDHAILTKPAGYVISSSVPVQNKCADATRGGSVPVSFRIGGAGPGGPEMSYKQLEGTRTSVEYQKHGPHHIGRILKDGSYCVEPSAMDVRDTRVYTINDDVANPPDSLIQTSYSFSTVCVQ